MRRVLPFVLAIYCFTTPAHAQSDLEKGFAGALRGCEEWVLNPASWAEGAGPFVAAVGLDGKMGLVERVEEVQLPPKELRVANHYWRINSTLGAGFMLVVSDRLPMCHITGGGDADLQPVVEAVLSSDDFKKKWERIQDNNSRSGMTSTVFRSRVEPSFSMAISRAKSAGERRDRVQVLATATMQVSE